MTPSATATAPKSREEFLHFAELDAGLMPHSGGLDSGEEPNDREQQLEKRTDPVEIYQRVIIDRAQFRICDQDEATVGTFFDVKGKEPAIDGAHGVNSAPPTLIEAATVVAGPHPTHRISVRGDLGRGESISGSVDRRGDLVHFSGKKNWNVYGSAQTNTRTAVRACRTARAARIRAVRCGG